MSSRTAPRQRTAGRLAALGGALVLALTLTACSGDGDDRATDPTAEDQGDELSAHGGEPCPETLPEPEESDGVGFGEPAESAPAVSAPSRGWVCAYDPADGEPTQDGGMSMAWERSGDPVELAHDDLEGVAGGLEELAPAEAERMCTMDLGPRVMLVTEAGGDLTGVVVDLFGCREVRMTDDPHDTPPGEGTQGGAVAGVLAAPEDLVTELSRLAGAGR